MKNILTTSFFISLFILVLSCQKKETLSINGWNIEIESSQGLLDFSNPDLGILLKNVQLAVKSGSETKATRNWKFTVENNALKIAARNPESEWIIKVSDTAISFSTKLENALVTAIAPAGEKRIPARTAEQDNDVMYTQMGFVSATNIHNLFDMKTDIMISFPENSRLMRNKTDNSLMDISFNPDGDADIKLIKNYYDEEVGLSHYERENYKPAYAPIADRFKAAPTGWSSWYCYYMSPSGESLFEETNAIAEKLKPYGIKYIQLDAAYSRGEDANWLNWYKGLYPQGGKVWFKQVKDKGLIPGLWLNIYGANYASPAMADKYPENFFLHDKDGKLSAACCSADKTVKRLDYTNPAVIEKHLKPLFETLVNEWGLGYLKAGGWGTWMDFLEKNRDYAFDPSKNSREIYRETHKVVREILGDKGYLLGCAMHEIGVGFEYFDGSRTGGDDYANWRGKNHWSGGMQTFFNSLFGSNYLNGITWWSDPDDVMIRDPLTMEEGKTIVSTISLSGQAYIFSDYVADFSKERLDSFLNSKFNIGWAKKYPDLVKPLPDEKIDLYRKTMPAMPVRAMDLYPFKGKAKCCPKPKSYPKALDLKVNSYSGVYDVVSLYNWADVDTLCTLDLEKDLGLDKNKKYVAFDFWNTKLIRLKGNKIEKTIPAHGTLALIIRPAEDHPQLMATSRHLTSAYSIKKYHWEDKTKTIIGKSRLVTGDDYTLFFVIPDSYKTTDIKVESSGEKNIVVRSEDGLLKVTFTAPKKESLDWAIHF